MDEQKPTQSQQWLIDRRIACPEAGYPLCDACFATVDEWAAANGWPLKEPKNV